MFYVCFSTQGVYTEIQLSNIGTYSPDLQTNLVHHIINVGQRLQADKKKKKRLKSENVKMRKYLFHYQITMLGSHNKVKQMLATVTSYGDRSIEHLLHSVCCSHVFVFFHSTHFAGVFQHFR